MLHITCDTSATTYRQIKCLIKRS